MGKYLFAFVILGVWFLFAPLRSASPPRPIVTQIQAKKALPTQTYGFVFHETTGITTYLAFKGKPTAIEFTSQSDQKALDALFALNWEILEPNADGKHIFVVGRFDPEVKRTPDGPHLAGSEDYHEFTLLRWYIVTPFKSYRNDDAMAEKPMLKHERLQSSDFKDFNGKENLDVTRLQSKRKTMNGMK